MGKATKKSLLTKAELFVCLREDIQKLSKAVQDFVTHIGDPVFDEYDEHDALGGYPIFEDEIENKEYSFIDQFGDGVFDATKPPIFDVVDKDDAEAVPIYDVLDEDEIGQVTDKKRIDESTNFNDSVYAQETPNFSNEDLVKSHGVTCDFHLKDKSPLFQTMIATVGRNVNFFSKSSWFNKREDHMAGPKPELVCVCKERANTTCMDLQKKHLNYGAWRKNFNRHINREPPDRVQQGREAEEEDTKFLNAKITKLEETLLLEQEKNQTLEHELRDIRRNIRMLNKGSITLDKILRMGLTEKTTAGLGYQGGPSGSHTVFVRSSSVETNKPDVVLESAKNQAMELSDVPNVYSSYCEISLWQHQGCVRQLWRTVIMRLFQQEDDKNCAEEDHYEKWVRIFTSLIESVTALIQSRGQRDMKCKLYKVQVILIDMPTVFQAMKYISVTTLAFAMNYAFFFMSKESKPSHLKYFILKILSYNITVVDILLMKTKIHGAVALLKQVKMLDTGWYVTFQRCDIVAYVPVRDHHEIVVHKGTTSELLVLLRTTDLAMARSGNSTEELNLPQFSELSALYCFTWNKLSDQKSLCCHHLQRGLIIQDVNFDVGEMLEQTGTVFSHREHCPMPKHVDFSKLAKYLLVNDDMLECTRLCVDFLNYSESFWYTRIDVDSHTTTGKGNIYSFNFDGRCMVLFMEPKIPIVPLLLGVIGSRQMTKESCSSSKGHLKRILMKYLVEAELRPMHKNVTICVVMSVQNSSHEYAQADTLCEDILKYVMSSSLDFVWSLILKDGAVLSSSSWELKSSYVEYIGQYELSFVFHLNAIKGLVMCLIAPSVDICSSLVLGGRCLVHPCRERALYAIAVQEKLFHDNRRTEFLNWWPLGTDKVLWYIPNTCPSVPWVHFQVISLQIGCGVFTLGMEAIYSLHMGCNCRSTTLICWSNVSCASGKLLCLVFVNDIIFFHGYTSLRSRTSGVNEFLEHPNHPMYHVLDSVEFKRGIQSLHHMVKNILHDANKVNRLEKDDYTCTQENHTMHWMLTEENEIQRNLKKEKITKEVVFLEVRLQQFRFEVESFKLEGT